jgi:hypothetical protein
MDCMKLVVGSQAHKMDSSIQQGVFRAYDGDQRDVRRRPVVPLYERATTLSAK